MEYETFSYKNFRTLISRLVNKQWVQPANLLNSVEIFVAYHVERNHRVYCPLIYTDCPSFGQTMAAASVACVCVSAIVSFRLTYKKLLCIFTSLLILYCG